MLTSLLFAAVLPAVAPRTVSLPEVRALTLPAPELQRLGKALDGRLVQRDDGSLSFVGRAPIDSRQLATHDDVTNAARAFVRTLLPQALTGDDALELASLEPQGDGATLVFGQLHRGVWVEGSHVLVHLEQGAITYARLALAHVEELVNHVVLTPEGARALGRELLSDRAKHARARSEVKLVVAHDGRADRFAYRVEVDLAEPYGYFAAYVDAQRGTLVRAEKLSGEAVNGEAQFKVDATCQGAGTALVGMPHVQWAAGKYANDAGGFYDAGAVANAQLALDSPYFKLVNHAGAIAGPWAYPLQAEPATNTLAVDTAPLDQVTPFFHAHKVRGWTRGRIDETNSQKAWTEQKVDLNVNLNSTCNAFYDGTINFFQGGGGCNNTGRVAQVVYHEYGHGVHDHSGGVFDGQVSEGVGDFIAATITNTPQISGLTSCGAAFRTCQNNYTYCSSGCTFGPGSEVHDAGQIICGVMWEFRQQLIALYGKDLGTANADRIFLKFLNLVGNMTSSYDAAIAADDDDDGNPANGTKHSCEINKAFADDAPGATAHFPDLAGKIPSQPQVTIKHEAPGIVKTTAGEPVRLEFEIEQKQGCAPPSAISAMTLYYKVPRADTKSVALTLQAGSTTRFVATIPDLAAPVTVEYYVVAKLGTQEYIYPYQGPRVPRDAKYPYYRQMVRFADDKALYTADFEANDGGLVATTTAADGVSDWEWGKPSGLGGDPAEAKSGTNVWGTDLGTSGDGAYSRGRKSTLELPPMDFSQHSEVRLQFWRKLLSADVARVEVNGLRVWENRAGAFFWRDPVWMFTDLDLSTAAAAQKNVVIRFVMEDTFDDSFQLGGLTLDDLRVVAGGSVQSQEEIEDELSKGFGYEESNCANVRGSSLGALLALMLLGRGRRRHGRGEA